MSRQIDPAERQGRCQLSARASFTGRLRYSASQQNAVKLSCSVKADVVMLPATRWRTSGPGTDTSVLVQTGEPSVLERLFPARPTPLSWHSHGFRLMVRDHVHPIIAMPPAAPTHRPLGTCGITGNRTRRCLPCDETGRRAMRGGPISGVRETSGSPADVLIQVFGSAPSAASRVRLTQRTSVSVSPRSFARRRIAAAFSACSNGGGSLRLSFCCGALAMTEIWLDGLSFTTPYSLSDQGRSRSEGYPQRIADHAKCLPARVPRSQAPAPSWQSARPQAPQVHRSSAVSTRVNHPEMSEREAICSYFVPQHSCSVVCREAPCSPPAPRSSAKITPRSRFPKEGSGTGAGSSTAMRRSEE